ncbi:MAG: amino acid ABC transporter substrate-binding protein [Enterococcus sp.]
MKKSRLITISGVALLSLAVLGACSSADESSDSTDAKEKVLRVGTEGTYSPFSYRDADDKLVGYDVEVAEAVAKKIGYQIEFVDSPWDSMLAAFDADKTDVVFNQVSITDERKEKYDFSVPYSVSHVALITKKGNTEINDFTDLDGKKSAQSLTSNFATLAEEHGAELVTTDGFSKSAELVLDGQADATLNDDVTFYDYLNQKPDAELEIAKVSDETTEVGALFHKGDDELREAVDEALTELHDDGTLTKLSEEYFDKDISK